MTGTFFGKYRGIVSDNEDPDNLGRIRARVQEVFDQNESGWAMPSVPYAGDGVGLYLIPPRNTWVWIEFEHGDPSKPIWSGCFWGSSRELPLQPVTPSKKVLKTDAGTMTFDGSSAITIEMGTSLKIKMDSQGIEISNGTQKIVITSSSVSIDDGALEVM
jgi:uncharacterized protein involved in type VI secretion and phage assembly